MNDGMMSIKHVIVYKEPGRFCGWPANNGMWAWGNEILVGFGLGYYKESVDRHSIDRDRPSEGVMARSLDGGESWNLERPKGLSVAIKESEMPGQGPIPCPGGINFTHPDFAMMCRGRRFYISYDRGKTWEGPYEFPTFDQGYLLKLQSRTDYIANGQHDCLLFLTAAKRNNREGRPLCVRTSDGGKTFEFISWIAPEPTGYSIMPSSVRLSESQIISAIRRRENAVETQNCWISVYISNDNGGTWEFLSKPADVGLNGGNPPSMIKSKDGRICLAYGVRATPYGIRAKLSRDNGMTWDKEIVLREDGRTWDIGYTRMVQRPDGKNVAVYYYSTDENREQHIAATIWDPDLVG